MNLGFVRRSAIAISRSRYYSFFNRHFLSLSALILLPNCYRAVSKKAMSGEYYRHDGVRITHDPYAAGMAEKYGTPGKTDQEGFDPYGDSVGAGIYGGRVERDGLGRVVIGRQYQNHNPTPGPVYLGGGYAPIAEKLSSDSLKEFLTKYPDLVNDITTGGAQPLHMCGMSRRNENQVRDLVEFGADLEALDTYGMTPLHRMASNNLAAGARMLLEAGAQVDFRGGVGQTPIQVAQGSRGKEVIDVLNEFSSSSGEDNISELRVDGAELISQSKTKTPSGGANSDSEPTEISLINGLYLPRDGKAEIPSGFDKVCQQQKWETDKMWAQLSGRQTWFKHSENESYIYFNLSDKQWWIDGPSGNGVFIIKGPKHAPPAHGWKPLAGTQDTVVLPPMVRTFRRVAAWESSFSSRGGRQGEL